MHTSLCVYASKYACVYVSVSDEKKNPKIKTYDFCEECPSPYLSDERGPADLSVAKRAQWTTVRAVVSALRG